MRSIKLPNMINQKNLKNNNSSAPNKLNYKKHRAQPLKYIKNIGILLTKNL